MDANGTRFHLVLGDDWQDCYAKSSDLSWDPDSHELLLKPVVYQFRTSPADRLPEVTDRRGAACDRYGNYYWIGENDSQILVYSTGTEGTSLFWPPGQVVECSPEGSAAFGPLGRPTPRQRFAGLTVTGRHFLVVGVLSPPGLLIFDLQSGGPPRQLFWPDGVRFVPFDMAPRHDGGVFVLDRVNRRYWVLDQRFYVLCQPADSGVVDEDGAFEPGCAVERGVWRREEFFEQAACRIQAVKPVGIEALPDGTALILESDLRQPWSKLHHYEFSHALGEPIDIPFAIAPMPTDQPGRLGHDFVFIEDYQGPDSSGSDRLYVAVDNGNQSYVFQLSWRDPQLALKLIPFYLPMRLFGGKALVSDGRQVYYDHRGRWLPLVQEERPRFVLKAEVRRKFDAGAPNCVWHRLMLDGCIPPGTSVRVSSRDSDDEDQLEILPWQDEPDFYLRRDGSEQPFTGLRTKGGRGTWELLLQQASGRFLELRLNIEGNGRSTPRLRALRVYYPRFSYLNRYLPAVYREEPEPASFLDRFLANLEGFYTAIEDKIAMVDLLFDPESAPSETLGWLIGWFGVTTDPAWDPDRQRLFLRHAGELLQARGTIPGILMALRLAFDQAPGDEIFRAQNAVRKGSGGLRIVEKYRRRLTPRVPAQAGGAKIQKLWSDFLARRYSSVSFLNNKQGTYWKRFEDISTPQTLPSDEAQRDDWHDFQSVVTPLHSTAHQFTVFLPMPLGSIDPSERRRRQELVERVVNLEKPAHTLFDVKFYWESFAVGSARLGDDTLLGPGGRNPALMTGMVLGRGHLAETYLAPYPRVERYYVGSESLGPKRGVAQEKNHE